MIRYSIDGNGCKLNVKEIYDQEREPRDYITNTLEQVDIHAPI